MGQKVNPIGFRLGVRRNWSARWYANKGDYAKFVEEDCLIRGFLDKKLRFASVPRVVIERASIRTRVSIWTARPGIVIGRKGQELAVNAFAVLVFWWDVPHRQVRVEGIVEKVTAEESDAYFQTRPRGSQLGTRASAQSAVAPDRKTLEAQMHTEIARFEGQAVPRPPHWGGYCVIPNAIEFWQGRPDRLHDRLRYIREAEGWRIERLAP